MRSRDAVFRSAVCHGATLTPSGILESVTPFGAVEAEAKGTANAVTASTPVAEMAA